MVRRARVLVGWGILASAAAATGGCGWILGLDEFTDRPAGAAGGAGGGGCTSAQECPTGEHGSPTCEAGVCGFACADGFANCDEAVGCEAPTDEDKQNCGGCGVSCAAYCSGGTCNDPVDIAVGYNHACAVLKDGTVWCWGARPSPDGPPTSVALPARVELDGPAIQVAANGSFPGSGSHTCALLQDRTLRCWGSNGDGQLGLGDTQFRAVPAAPDLENIRQISLGSLHTCAVDLNDTLFCWGANSKGQIGTGSTTSVSTPVQIATSIAQVSAGSLHSCAVLMNGYTRCWGSNYYGELGNGSDMDALTPVLVHNLTQTREVACGLGHTCAFTAFGAFCWGDNTSGKLGLGDEVDRDEPEPLTLGGVTSIAVGYLHSGALVDGALYMWGDNGNGQLGDGTANSTSTPRDVNLGKVQKIALGSLSSCALLDGGEVLCWGDNTYGQLGNGTMNGSSSPMPVVWP